MKAAKEYVVDRKGDGGQIQGACAESKDGVRQAVREASPWVLRFGRIGFAAIGIVYLLVGFLAAYAAISSTRAGGTRDALREISHLPFGQVLLVTIAVGLVCHALWRLTQALLDTDRKGSDAKGYAARAGFALIALLYFGMALAVAKIFLGGSGGGAEGFWARSWTGWILAQPFGALLISAFGAGVFAAGVFFFYQALSAEFRETLLLSKMSARQERWGTRCGRFGFAARGVVFCIMGVFLMFSAWYSDPGVTRDFGGALRIVERQPYGAWLLALVAGGLFSYGLFVLFLARFRRLVCD